jgi:hypothetical protein
MESASPSQSSSSISPRLPSTPTASDLVTLNVGGKIYSTTKSTLLSQKSVDGGDTFFHSLFHGKFGVGPQSSFLSLAKAILLFLMVI